MKLNKYIDHTLLKPDASFKEIEKLCHEAIDFNFASVCVNPCFVTKARKILVGSDVKVCTVIGFPLGANTIESKVFETQDAIANGADEIDMVLNISFLKEKQVDYIVREITEIKKACGRHTLKVIIETCLLENEEKRMACDCIKTANANFVKTSTGFSKSGATVDDVRFLKSIVGDRIQVKASGGIKSYEEAMEMIDAGADRIGTSRGVALIEQEASSIKE